jgi:CRP-like cAMP-binding protein
MLEPGAFFGEGCLAGQRVCMATATAEEDSTLIRIDKQTMIRALHDNPDFSTAFMGYLLTRNIRIQEDLVDHLFNSSEKRLARLLLLMAHFGKEGKPETIIAKISQETLAEMIGTTRSRVSFFMNKFRKLGFLEYSDEGQKKLHVHSSLLNVVLHD